MAFAGKCVLLDDSGSSHLQNFSDLTAFKVTPHFVVIVPMWDPQ